MRRAVLLAVALVGTLLLFCAGSAEHAVGQVIMAGQQIQFSENTFDKSNFNQRTAIAARKHAEDALRVQLEFVEKVTDLSDGQREKLSLAGQLDIHRFFAEYTSTKRGLTFGTISREKWQAEFARARQAISPLKERYLAGLHGESSLFAKSMNAVLEREQRSKVREMNDARNRYRYRVFIGAALAIIEQDVPLTVEERTKITELLLAKTEPPVIAERRNMPTIQVLKNMAVVQDELSEFLAPNEWAVFENLIRSVQKIPDARP